MKKNRFCHVPPLFLHDEVKNPLNQFVRRQNREAVGDWLAGEGVSHQMEHDDCQAELSEWEVVR